VNAWENRDAGFIGRLRETPAENLLWVSAISIGELESGHRITATTDAARRAEANAFIHAQILPFCLDVTHSTRTYYAQILERIWRKYPPASGKRTEMHLAEKGVDMNDVWNVAAAWEHGLIFLTTDKMAVIREAAPEVAFDSWVA
jgi:predicted nucleic acid-binding protein